MLTTCSTLRPPLLPYFISAVGCQENTSPVKNNSPIPQYATVEATCHAGDKSIACPCTSNAPYPYRSVNESILSAICCSDIAPKANCSFRAWLSGGPQTTPTASTDTPRGLAAVTRRSRVPW